MRVLLLIGLIGVALSAPWTSQLGQLTKARTTVLSSTSCSTDGYLLLLRQTVPTYLSYSAWINGYNAADPSQPNYSILNTLGDSYKGSDGKFQFKIVWPQRSGTNYNIWKQTTNPVTSTASVSGYEAVNVHFTSNRWGGIENGQRHGGSAPYAALDGSVNHGNWYYAIGSKQEWGGGIPGASSAENVVEFYVYGCPSTPGPTTLTPTAPPTFAPTPTPSHTPTETPTTHSPSPSPSHTPTEHPTAQPTGVPTVAPTPAPTNPSMVPNCHCTGCENHYATNEHNPSSHADCIQRCKNAGNTCQFSMYNTGTTHCYLYNAAQKAKLSYTVLDNPAVATHCYDKAYDHTR